MSKKDKRNAAHLPENGPIDANGKEILLSIKNVDITFGKGDSAVRAVKNANFDIYKGETFSLVGESGSGKSVFTKSKYICSFVVGSVPRTEKITPFST